jgi:DNA/RNA endonuclease G (NUC1)
MRAAAWGRSGDEGGHLIPAKYGGPGHLLNLLPQARNINRSVIKKIENEMGRHLKNGAVVEYTVKPVYTNPISHRPDMFDIICNINGNINYWKVKND